MDRVRSTHVNGQMCNTLWKHSRLVRQEKRGFKKVEVDEKPQGDSSIPPHIRAAVAKLLFPRREK
jgi:hypothetical protein